MRRLEKRKIENKCCKIYEMSRNKETKLLKRLRVNLYRIGEQINTEEKGIKHITKIMDTM